MRLLRTLDSLGIAPESNRLLDMSPVDYVAPAIVALAVEDRHRHCQGEAQSEFEMN